MPKKLVCRLILIQSEYETLSLYEIFENIVPVPFYARARGRQSQNNCI